MNRFELRLSARHVENDPLGYLVVEANVDERPLTDFDKHAVDLHQFNRSLEKDGEYFIITCWCGDPACANITSGVTVFHKGDSVVWQTDLGGEPARYEFERSAYVDAPKKLQAQAKELLDILDTTSHDGELTIVPIHNRPFLNN